MVNYQIDGGVEDRAGTFHVHSSAHGNELLSTRLEVFWGTEVVVVRLHLYTQFLKISFHLSARHTVTRLGPTLQPQAGGGGHSSA